MLMLSPERIQARASFPQLIEALRAAFRAGGIIPSRQILPMVAGRTDRLLISMPAFDLQGGAVVKLATFLPDNETRGLATIQAVIVVFSPSGTPLAVLDGTVITRLRTAAASALASTYLSRPDSAHLVVIGTGALAPFMAAAHCAVRPIGRVSFCGRRPERAAAAAASAKALIARDVKVQVTTSIEEAVATADIVCCATSSPTPILAGKWLRPGTLVDLVGSFSPSTREADDDVVRHARIFVDTFAGVMAEGGDIVEPLSRGVIARERIEGELSDLVGERVCGRLDRDEIIVFKSVGTALEDLAAAQLVTGASLSME